MEFKTDQGKTFTSNFDNDATEFIMKSRTEDSNSGKIIPYPFTSDEIEEIENIYDHFIKDNSTFLQSAKDYHLHSSKGEGIPDELDEEIEEIKDIFNRNLILNWELCEELFGGSGESIALEDESVWDDTMSVFEDTVLFYFAYLAK
jgi:hypothetical protein